MYETNLRLEFHITSVQQLAIDSKKSYTSLNNLQFPRMLCPSLHPKFVLDNNGKRARGEGEI
ncbi:MAG: hypothetical protein BRC47_14775 [Cyanobacteria bacterium QS_7_48_42]|jgi:hypothetical protein|nr:MAG: hypothetical protein BRC47_14775 [Cyanobacteria bacterium QS_7_48_42]PSP22938.1 MAG: hypothetical protein BRC55_11085 [Cyanobacteria bacterium SW_8_48_13]